MFISFIRTVSILSHRKHNVKHFRPFHPKRLKQYAEPFCSSLKNQEMVRLFTIFNGVVAEDVPLRTGKRVKSLR